MVTAIFDFRHRINDFNHLNISAVLKLFLLKNYFNILFYFVNRYSIFSVPSCRWGRFLVFLLFQFCHLVTAVERLADTWRVSSEDLTTKTSAVAAARYDAVIVCNGHFSTPKMPDIPAMDRYAGVVIHSHDYRAPERFRDADVLVVGAGPSGIDICCDVAKVASRVSAKVSGRPSELSIESASVAGIF